MPRSIPSVVSNKPNVPRHGVRIKSAFFDEIKLELPTGEVVGMDVPTFIEIAQSAGIKKGGIIPCPLIWIIILGGHHKLVRVGSAAHKEAVRKDEIRQHRPVKKQDLKVGGLYQSLSGYGLFLGHINARTINIGWPVIKAGSIQHDIMLWCVWWYAFDLPLEAFKRAATLKEQFEVLDDGPVFDRLSCSRMNSMYRFELRRNHQHRLLIHSIELTTEQAVATITELAATRLDPVYVVGTSAVVLSAFELEPVLAISASGRPRMSKEVQQALSTRDYIYIADDTPSEEFPELLIHQHSEVRAYAKEVLARIQGGTSND